jgi:hypothetical protein
MFPDINIPGLGLHLLVLQASRYTTMPLKIVKKDLSGLTVLVTGANVGEYKQPINVQLIPA